MLNLENLNPAQREAVEMLEGPLLIVAGAGSGKTRVLTTRTALLMDMGIMPERILALTFTRKAAQEMRSRIMETRGEDARRLRMGTFHGVLASMLRPWAAWVGYRPDFTIMDEEDSRRCLGRCTKAVLSEQRPPEEEWTDEQAKRYEREDRDYSPRLTAGRISKIKNGLKGAQEYAADTAGQNADSQDGMPLLWKIFAEYEAACRRSNTMDFDDILLLTWRLLAGFPDVRRQWAACFDFVMVDEFQDTNRAQAEILRLLTVAEGRMNVCVVGDDSQSIYAFRGADIGNILNFQRTYSGCRVVKLERNYRSTSTIVEAANRLIEKNTNRIPKTCTAENGAGGEIGVWQCTDERQEASFVASTMAERHAQGRPWGGMAVLYRTNAQSRALEDALRKRKVPYVIHSGTSFYDRQEIRDALACMRVTVNPHDDEALMRIANRPSRGISDNTLAAAAACARAAGKSVWDILDDARLADTGLKVKALGALRDFKELFRLCQEKTRSMDAGGATAAILSLTGILGMYEESDAREHEDRAQNIQELADAAAAYALEAAKANREIREGEKEDEGLGGFLQNAVLTSAADTEDAGDAISLMTVHASKGLEFADVFITGMEAGLFPLRPETDRDEEEERRLFYVAVTRARENLDLTWTERRMRYGHREDNEPSKFIEEMMGTLEY